MPTVFTEVTTNIAGEVPADFATNTVWHTIGTNLFDPATGYQSHCDEVARLFAGSDPTHGLFKQYAGRIVTAKVYDFADPVPRPEKAVSIINPAAPIHENDLGPRQVALVLAFYGQRNLKSQRGHIYIGPLLSTWTSEVMPETGFMQQLIDLGHGLFDIGGEDVAHVIHSRVHNSNVVVANYWVDNRWDTVRKRLPKATNRLTLAP